MSDDWGDHEQKRFGTNQIKIAKEGRSARCPERKGEELRAEGFGLALPYLNEPEKNEKVVQGTIGA